MVVDYILDRKFGSNYVPKNFYVYCSGEYSAGMKFLSPIIFALDYGTENDVKQELKKYIDAQGYNPDIKEYIDSVSWL